MIIPTGQTVRKYNRTEHNSTVFLKRAKKLNLIAEQIQLVPGKHIIGTGCSVLVARQVHVVVTCELRVS